jgi:hypothetical protein
MNTVVFLLSLVTSAVIFSIDLAPQTMAQIPNNGNQTTTNFSEEISKQISSDTFLVNVAYGSPKTVVLQGSDGKSSVGGEPGQFAFNDFLWRAVDLLKDKGFVIDQIDLLNTGGNTDLYRIYMSIK